MFPRPVARRRIGSSPFCVRRVWSISSASLRNPLTTITTRRFPRFWIRCASQNKKGKSAQRLSNPVEVGVLCLLLARRQLRGILSRIVPAIDFGGTLQCFANAAADILRTDMAFELGLLHQLRGLFACSAEKQ